MLRNNKAFMLIEILFATSIIFLSLSFIIPSFMLLNSERKTLYTEIHIVQQLEMELHQAVQRIDHIPFLSSGEIDGIQATYAFTKEEELIKGCVTWETTKRKEKSTCLYKMQ